MPQSVGGNTKDLRTEGSLHLVTLGELPRECMVATLDCLFTEGVGGAQKLLRLNRSHRFNGQALYNIYLPPTLIPLSGVGTTCFSSCCDKDSAIIFTTGRLPEVKPP
jgi:hypothetical protein